MIKYPIVTDICPHPKDARFRDLTGLVVHKLTVIHYVGKRAHKNAWLCQCECGKITNTTTKALLRGDIQSCGCTKTIKTHGMWNHPLYQTWNGMIQRCTKPLDAAYPRYGGRGITICDRWMNIHNFIADMGDKPQGMSLERIDNDKGYSPDNCIWATPKEQANNRRSNILITIQERTQNVTQWAIEYGLSPFTIYTRLNKGWAPEDAVLIPIRSKS